MRATEDVLADAIRDLVREAVAAEVARVTAAPTALLSVEAAAERLGIGRTYAYDLVMSGRLRSLRVGRRRLIPADAITDYVAAAEDA